MKTPATHRGRRGSRAPASADDGYGGYGSSYDDDDDDDDDDRSCLSPAADVSDLGCYQELALTACESEGNKTGDDDEVSIGDGGFPKPPSSSPPPPSSPPPLNSSHGGV